MRVMVRNAESEVARSPNRSCAIPTRPMTCANHAGSGAGSQTRPQQPITPADGAAPRRDAVLRIYPVRLCRGPRRRNSFTAICRLLYFHSAFGGAELTARRSRALGGSAVRLGRAALLESSKRHF